MALRLGSVAHPSGGLRLGDIAYAPLGSLAVQGATHAHTADSPALVQSHVLEVADATHGHSADSVALVVAERSVSAGEASDVPAGVITFTLTNFGEPTGVTIAGVSASFTGDSESIDVTLPAYDDFVQGGAHEATPWDENVTVVVSDAGGSASTVIQIDPPEAEGDDWWLQATEAAGDAIDAPGIEVGEFFAARRLYGTGVQLLANRSSSASSESWGFALKYWDESANDGNGAWSEVTATHFPIWLTVEDSTHAHTAESPALVQAYALEAADSSHAHSADGVELSFAQDLDVSDAQHAHSADVIDLGVAHVLSVEDVMHAHTVDALNLTQAHVLVVADALHLHLADALELGQGAFLVPADATHGHTAEAPDLSQALLIEIQDALHSHLAEAPSLLQDGVLVVSDALHAHLVDNVTLPGTLFRSSRLVVVRAADRVVVVTTRDRNVMKRH